MPNPDNMLFVRPKNCRFCGHGYYGLQHALQYANSKGWDTIDIAAENANQIPVYTAIDNYDPATFYGFGHGNNCIYTGDAEEGIFTCDECNRLNGRMVYLLSCLTANGLGPEMIRQGALAYAGFNISWTWLSDTGTDGDPYADKYARGFWESANELWMSLCDGMEFRASVQKSVAKYNEWIEYWFYTNPEDPFSQECIKWLAFDRDGLVALDVCDAITDEVQCAEYGCHWYNGHCNSNPQAPIQSGGLILAAISVALIVGVASYMYKNKKKFR